MRLNGIFKRTQVKQRRTNVVCQSMYIISKYVKVYHSMSKYVKVYIVCHSMPVCLCISWLFCKGPHWVDKPFEIDNLLSEMKGNKRGENIHDFPWLDLTHRAHFSILELRMLEAWKVTSISLERSPFEERRAQQQAEREAWACAVYPYMFLRLYMMQEDTRISFHPGWYIYIYVYIYIFVRLVSRA